MFDKKCCSPKFVYKIKIPWPMWFLLKTRTTYPQDFSVRSQVLCYLYDWNFKIELHTLFVTSSRFYGLCYIDSYIMLICGHTCTFPATTSLHSPLPMNGLNWISSVECTDTVPQRSFNWWKLKVSFRTSKRFATSLSEQGKGTGEVYKVYKSGNFASPFDLTLQSSLNNSNVNLFWNLRKVTQLPRQFVAFKSIIKE